MKKFFYLDLRSLALARVLLGIVFLYDLAVRFGHREAFYTDYGVLPRNVLLDGHEIAWKMSLLLLNGTVGFVNILIAIGVFAGILFTLGIRTRVSGFVCWILLMSFQSRNPMLGHGGDNIFRMLFFWGMFLPLNAEYSFDRILSKVDIKTKEISDVFSAGLILQVCFIYLFTTIYKIDSSWMTDFSSIYYALSLDMFTKPLGDWLLQFHGLTQVMTAMTMLLEAFGIFLLFVPFKNQLFRLLAVLMFLGLHVGIFMTFRLGTFAPACIIAWLMLLPPIFWDTISKYFRSNANIKIYYDADCGFCLKMVGIVKTFLYLPQAEVAPAQSDKAILKDMENKNSWVVIVDGKKYFAFEAIAQLIRKSKLVFIFFPLLILSPIGHWLYQAVASRRNASGGFLNQCGYSAIKLDAGYIKKFFGLFIICLIFAWNVEGTNTIKGFDLKGGLNDIAFTLQLNQQWNMFAPSPMTGDGWFIVEGMLENGKVYDIFNNREYTEARPKQLEKEYQDVYWQKYLLSLKFGGETWHTLYFARYLCRNWNDHHPRNESVKTFKIHYMMELTPKMGAPVPAPEKNTLWVHNCY
jgi:predicted DCC family thiol-disulfide oxidoreductase YuxK